MARTTNKSRKMSTHMKSDNDDHRATAAWNLLPLEMLFLILVNLSFVDYYAFSGVCQDWRKAAKAHEENFMKHHRPFIVSVSRRSKRACIARDIFVGREYKVMLPDLTRRRFFGLSGGYLIMLLDDSGFYLVNLLTRHELQFPVISCFFENFSGNNLLQPIVFYSTKLSDYMMVVIDRISGSLLVAQSRGAKWIRARNPDNIQRIVDVAIWNKKIYFLTSDASFGEVKVHHASILQLLNSISVPTHFSSRYFVTSSKSLFVVLHSPFQITLEDIIIYKLDDTKMEWTKVNDLCQDAVILSDTNSSAIVDPTMWGGHSSSSAVVDALYVTKSYGEGKWVWEIPLVARFGNTIPSFWYFPHDGLEKVE